MQKITVLAILAVSLCSPAYTAVDYHSEVQPQAIERVLRIEQKGVLKQKANGYLYLAVARDFIAQTLPLIEAAGKIVPPSHYTSKKGIGAHISVIDEREMVAHEIWEIAELGQEYTFELVELRTIKLYKKNKVQKLWLIAAVSPELENLRLKYGLPPLLNKHDFHITIGTQVPGKAEAIEPDELKEAA